MIIIIIAVNLDVVFEKYIILGNEYAGFYKVNRIITYNDSTETPIFGNSHDFNGIIPDSLGNNFYNYSMQGIGEDMNNFFLSEECKKKRTSPLIISDINLEGFGLLRKFR